MMPAMHLTSNLTLTETDFQWFANAIKRLAGIKLSRAKQDLVRTRLRSRLAERNCKDFREYRGYLECTPEGHPEWQEFVNQLTTNKTDFFREPKHFDYLVNQFLPAWLERGEKTLKVWSCACSTGEEPYTLAMLLATHLPEGRDFKILASDIDTDVLSRAKNGVYQAAKLSEIPASYQKFVDLGRKELADWFRIKNELCDKIEFRQHNLIGTPPPPDERFHLVLCRNVLIYFPKETVQSITRKLHGAIEENGVLFIGHSESICGDSLWKTKAPAIYERQDE